MQMIATVVSGQQLGRVAWVTHCLIEVNYTVEFASAPNPGVDLLPYVVFPGSVKAAKERAAKEGVLEGWNRGANDADSFLVSARDELTITGCDALRIHALRCWYEGAGKQYVVDAEGDDDVLDASLREHVAFEAFQARLAKGRPQLYEDRSERMRPSGLSWAPGVA